MSEPSWIIVSILLGALLKPILAMGQFELALLNF